MLSALAVQMYLIIYVFMFAAAMKLRKTQPNVKRGYRAPAIHFWSILGILSSVLALLLGFLPPSQFKMLPPPIYVGTLVFGLVITAAPAFLFYKYRKPSWQLVPKAESDRYSAALQDLDAEAAAAAAKPAPAVGVAAKS
jgi:glutamate:GABA antiporter